MYRSGLFRVVFGLAATSFAASGCGPSGPQYAEVSGKVTYKGETVNVGQVYFKIVDGEYSGGATLKDGGTYSSKGIPVGKCKVMVKTKSSNPKAGEVRSSGPPAGRPGGSGGPPPGYGGPPGAGGPPGGGRPGTTPKIPDFVGKTNPNDGAPGKFVATPEKYENETTSTLEFEVKPGVNTFNIELKD